VQCADACLFQSILGGVSMFRAAGVVACIDDRGDARLQRSHCGQPRAQEYVHRAIVSAQRLRPARHHDGAGSINHFCIICLQIRTNGGNPGALYQNIADNKIGDVSIHGDNGAAFEKSSIVAAHHLLQWGSVTCAQAFYHGPGAIGGKSVAHRCSTIRGREFLIELWQRKSFLLKVKGLAMSFDGRLLSGMSGLAAVVESGSYTRAGELLGLPASGVSRSISRLEEHMVVRLLDRTTRALHLTGEGARIYALAAPHLSGIEEAENTVASSATTVRGLLRVSLNPLFSRHMLAPRLLEFKARYPEINLLQVSLPDAGDLVAEGIDFAVRFGQQQSSAMTSRKLVESRVLTVASPAYIQKHGAPKNPKKLAKHDCIQFIDHQRGSEVLEVETSGSLTLTDVDTMIGACIAGAGISQVLALGMGPLLQCDALVELLPDWPGEKFPLHIIRPSRRLPPAAVQVFMDFFSD